MLHIPWRELTLRPKNRRMMLLCRHISHEVRKPIKVSNLLVVLLLLVLPVRRDLKINTDLFLDV